MASKTLRRTLRYAVAAILLLAGIGLLGAWWLVRHSLPQVDGTVSIPELQHEVLVDRDAWGVPRIRANSLDDLVTAQGYVMAQDRLWQMDIIRRAAAGDLAEIFGPALQILELDRENRTLGIRRAAERTAAALTPEERSIAEAYARGVNRFIDDHHSELPLEFTLLRYKPRPWTPVDSFLVSGYMWKGLSSSWRAELNRAKLTELVGPERAKDLFVIDSAHDHYIVGGAPPENQTPSPGKRASDGHSPESFTFSARANALEGIAAPPEWTAAAAILRQFDQETSAMLGSNNWVVSGAHTQSGKPLLANDPHLALGVPSIWYMLHVEAPGINAKGVTLPGAPLIIIGHNDRIAWGFTNNGAGVQDLYIETFNPANAREYLVNGAWVPATVRHEIIHIKGAPDQTLDVLETRHGPIVSREGGRAYALRWTATETGGMGFGFSLLCRAKNWEEFRAAMRGIYGPAQNGIYADVDGNIGFIVAANIPVRRSGDGALPVPGDTDAYEWTGYIPFDELPQVLNPPGGIIATANARTVGPAYPHFLTERWANPYRTERIYQLLENRAGLVPADFNAIQNDIVSLPDRIFAQQLTEASRRKQPSDPRARELLDGLPSWDGQMRANSSTAAFLEFTRHALLQILFQPFTHGDATGYEWWDFTNAYESVWLRDKVFLENVIRDRPARWLPSAYQSFDDLLMAAADRAVANLEKETKSRTRAGWGWGKINFLLVAHPLGRGRIPLSFLNFGPMEQSGSLDTVKAMGHGHGPSMRFVADLSNFDNSYLEISTGESGQFGSPYYGDQFGPWNTGRAIPETYSDAAEQRVRAHTLRLVPAAQSAPAR